MNHIFSLKRLLLLAALLIIMVSLQTAVAQDGTIPLPETLSIAAPASSELIIIAAETDNPPEPVLAPAISRSLNAVKTANIQVNYIDKAATWDTQPGAEAAFQYAVDIWSTLISSPVTIVVDAYWVDLSYISSNILGAARAINIHANSGSFPYANTWYPAALANSLAGYDLGNTSGGNPSEIMASFNSSFPDWYFGTDYNTPSSDHNFVSVVLHEIGHGLGFFGSMRYDDGQEGIECRGITREGCWGYVTQHGNTYPVIYDRFTENGSGTALLNTGIYPNPSIQLGLQLTSNNIYFDGANARDKNGGGAVPLYAPAAWSQGSSYSHLGEFFNNTENALMTYSLTNGETNYHPGPVTLGMFKDMGWSVFFPAELAQLPGQLLGVNTQLTNTIDAYQYTLLEQGFEYNLSYAMTDFGDTNAGISFNGRYVSINPQSGWTGKTTATIQVTDQTNQPSSSTFTVVVADEIHNVYLPTIVK